jgi:hypothetical protein
MQQPVEYKPGNSSACLQEKLYPSKAPVSSASDAAGRQARKICSVLAKGHHRIVSDTPTTKSIIECLFLTIGRDHPLKVFMRRVP